MDKMTAGQIRKIYDAHLSEEPPMDAGGHPSARMHEVTGDAWADWEELRRALRSAIAETLVRGYLGEDRP